MREKSNVFKGKRIKFEHDLEQVSFFLFIALALLFSSSLAVALEPPRAGEIERLKQTGEFSARLEHAKALGNHLIDPNLLERALYKARREALIQQGFTTDDILPAPPPAWKLMPTTGTVKVFALLIDFSDYPHYNSVEGINSALFGNGSLIPSNSFPYESLASYYSRSSYNLLNLSSGLTLGWYRPAYDRASMPMTTAARESLIKEAITYFKGFGQDFSEFDNDGDGKIEYFIVIWTGPDNGWANFWWGYQTSFSDQTFTVDGKTLGKYSWQWEYDSGSTYQGPFSPRVAIHETGHGLGLPDYYDYDSTVGPDGGVGGLDMMDHNWGDHNSFSKWVLEWVTPTVVATGSQSLTLNPSGTSQDAVLIMPGASSSDPFGEFFIAQNRYRVGNDTPYPTNGMLIWHVDATLDASATDYLYNNSYTSHKLLKLMQADGLDRIENYSAAADSAMYYTPGKTLTPTSNPSSKNYMGIDTRVDVTGISQSGQQMSATFSIDAVSTLATLNVTKSGTCSGTVTSVPDGISCGDDCAESYTPGTSVTLRAVPPAGCAFTGWAGGGCSGTGSCIVTMSADMAVTANCETTVILSENFNAQVLPSGWTIQINAGGGWWWFNYPNYNNSGGSGGCALGAAYSAGPYDIEMRTTTLNLSSFHNVGLEFKTGIAASGSTADVDVSVNGSAGPWTNVWEKIGVFTGPQTVNVDLSSVAAGNSDAMLRFRTYGAGIWWVIDDVKVMASTSCTYSITPTSTTIGSVGGPGSVSVTAGSGCNWTATSNTSWITITSGSSGSGNGTVNYSVAANTNTGSRSGTVTIAGQIFTVNQAGGTISLGEAVDNAALTWTTGGNANWYGQASVYYSGGDAARSGYITDNQSSWMETTVTGPGTLTFYWKVSSEASYDFLRFYIDGVEQSGGISGTVDWQQKTYSISSGSHTLRWAYTKDVSLSNGSDAGWVDYIVFNPMRTLTVASSNPNSGVNITVSPADNGGYGSGTTQFLRTHNNNTYVTLTAPSTASGNNFGSWGGCDSSSENTCYVMMNTNKAVTAIYMTPTTLPIMRVEGGTAVGSYSTIQAAFNAAANGDIIEMEAIIFNEKPNFNPTVPIEITLKGGYDSAFGPQPGYTTINGALTISVGTITVEKLTIK